MPRDEQPDYARKPLPAGEQKGVLLDAAAHVAEVVLTGTAAGAAEATVGHYFTPGPRIRARTSSQRKRWPAPREHGREPGDTPAPAF
jgi:hypothetical protein